MKTTGVFCRPSCPSRSPRRENVSFHTTAAEAEAAGFRPCLRCRPLVAIGQDPSTKALLSISRFIEAHADEPLPLRRLARKAGLSPYHLQRRFKAALGVTPKEYQAAARLARFKASLRAGNGVASAVFEAGFGSTSRVYEQVHGRLGMTPSAYRAGGTGERIAYACATTVLGPMLMAATQRGVCFLQFGASESKLRVQLAREYPKATLQRSAASSTPALDAWISALDAHLSSGGPKLDVPLDLRGTAFQIRVWRFLMQVREGQVVSYSDLAAKIGARSAVRAVASACAANRIAILVPCHRVLRGDGGLGGYRWGKRRKRALLDIEARRALGSTPDAAVVRGAIAKVRAAWCR